MPRKLISFLGVSPYYDTKYTYSDNEPCFTPFAATAASIFFKPDQVLVLTTEDARKANFAKLVKNMQEHGFNPIDVPISSGKLEHEMWDIFEVIAKQLDEGDEIIFDITNGFRSLPVLSFIAAVYIKTIRKVTIEKLIYGAFEAGTTVKDNNNKIISSTTPIFDLSPFLSLLDWTTAVSTFQQTGRVENLAVLAKGLGGEPAKQFAEQLQSFSQELLAARPVGTAWAASKLPALLEQVKDDSRPESTPLGLLLDSIAETYQQFDLNRGPLATLDATYEEAKVKDIQFLKIQLDMIKWYIKKGLPIQATTLAREWLVSLADYYQDTAVNSFSYKERDKLSRYINNFIPPSNTPKVPDIQPSSRLKHHAQGIADVWDSIRNIRNDIAHCGYDRPKAKEAAKLQAHLDSLEEMLDQLLP